MWGYRALTDLDPPSHSCSPCGWGYNGRSVPAPSAAVLLPYRWGYNAVGHGYPVVSGLLPLYMGVQRPGLRRAGGRLPAPLHAGHRAFQAAGGCPASRSPGARGTSYRTYYLHPYIACSPYTRGYRPPLLCAVPEVELLPRARGVPRAA